MRVFFLRALSAYILLEAMCLARKTFPKAPEPRVLIISNDEKVVLLSAAVKACSCSAISLWGSTGFSAALGFYEVGSVEVLDPLPGLFSWSFSPNDLLMPMLLPSSLLPIWLDPNSDELILGGLSVSLTEPVLRLKMDTLLR